MKQKRKAGKSPPSGNNIYKGITVEKALNHKHVKNQKKKYINCVQYIVSCKANILFCFIATALRLVCL